MTAATAASHERTAARREYQRPTPLADYLSITKPRVISLLALVGVMAMPPAARGWPSLHLVVAVAFGGAFAAGGAHAINCWYDRDIDAIMHRTGSRPLPAGRIPAWHALVIGVALNVVSFTVLAMLANVLAAVLTLGGTVIYIVVYTVWLKRRHPQNIVIGGAAGAVPPLVGWVAVTGHMDVTALSLFAVILFWTPPHFWSLATMVGDDYARARVPMLPVVMGARAAAWRSMLYAALTVVCSLGPVMTGREGRAYMGLASALGAGFLAAAICNLRLDRWAKRLFIVSNAYLALLFVGLAVGAFLP